MGLPWRSLDRSPYVLLGEPARIAEQVRERQERIGLDWLIVPNSQIERFSVRRDDSPRMKAARRPSAARPIGETR